MIGCSSAVRYWWVNQNQTFRHELAGGYLWSPKRNADDTANHFYETMREVSPGDIVFSFVDTRVVAIGIAQSYCWESPKPTEFGTAGQNWANIGWRVAVRFSQLVHRMRPKEHINLLSPLLPSKYSPIRSSGDGNQVYLAEISASLAEVLGGLIGDEAQPFITGKLMATVAGVLDDLDVWEQRIETTLRNDETIVDTEKMAIIRARRGQGLFKQRVMEIERRCRITAVENPVHLVASHCKPWRDSSNDERLDGENGLLLTPSIDHLFDRGFIGFEDSGDLIVSPVAHKPSLQRMGVETQRVVNVGEFTEGQRRFLDFHRNAVLLRAVR
jgi:putative restriction endonuclease